MSSSSAGKSQVDWGQTVLRKIKDGAPVYEPGELSVERLVEKCGIDMSKEPATSPEPEPRSITVKCLRCGAKCVTAADVPGGACHTCGAQAHEHGDIAVVDAMVRLSRDFAREVLRKVLDVHCGQLHMSGDSTWMLTQRKAQQQRVVQEAADLHTYIEEQRRLA